MDSLPETAAPFAQRLAAPLPDVLRVNLDTEARRELAGIVASLRVQVLVRVVQEVTSRKDETERLEALKRVTSDQVGGATLYSILVPHIEDADRLADDHAGRRELRALLRAVFEQTRRTLGAFVLSGRGFHRQAARLLIAERFAGCTRKSWEDLSVERHISERLLRQEMRAAGLPSSHV